MGKKHKKDPSTWKIIRYRDDHYADNCKSGYKGPAYHQVHHIIPVASVSDATIRQQVGDKASFIRKCLRVTEWDINRQPNCVGLPLKRAYPKADTTLADWATLDKWPCHIVDHPPYTDDVSDDLGKHVWDQAIENSNDCKLDPKTLKAELEARRKFWRREVRRRGSRKKGTRHCWDNRTSLPTTWYIPFSMALKPKERSAPAKSMSGSVKAYLKKLFAPK
jgi:hypothetical protein